MARDERSLTREFFGIHPDYLLAKTLALDVLAGTVSYEHARSLLAEKSGGTRLYGQAIAEKLEGKKVRVGGGYLRLKDLSEDEIMKLDNNAFAEVLEFYLKNPYAHGRSLAPRFPWPRLLRTRFLRRLVGEAKRRGIKLGFFSLDEFLQLV